MAECLKVRAERERRHWRPPCHLKRPRGQHLGRDLSPHDLRGIDIRRPESGPVKTVAWSRQGQECRRQGKKTRHLGRRLVLIPETWSVFQKRRLANRLICWVSLTL